MSTNEAHNIKISRKKIFRLIENKKRNMFVCMFINYQLKLKLKTKSNWGRGIKTVHVPQVQTGGLWSHTLKKTVYYISSYVIWQPYEKASSTRQKMYEGKWNVKYPNNFNSFALAIREENEFCCSSRVERNYY